MSFWKITFKVVLHSDPENGQLFRFRSSTCGSASKLRRALPRYLSRTARRTAAPLSMQDVCARDAAAASLLPGRCTPQPQHAASSCRRGQGAPAQAASAEGEGGGLRKRVMRVAVLKEAHGAWLAPCMDSDSARVQVRAAHAYSHNGGAAGPNEALRQGHCTRSVRSRGYAPAWRGSHGPEDK
jgi:hypothetical protein